MIMAPGVSKNFANSLHATTNLIFLFAKQWSSHPGSKITKEQCILPEQINKNMEETKEKNKVYFSYYKLKIF